MPFWYINSWWRLHINCHLELRLSERVVHINLMRFQVFQGDYGKQDPKGISAHRWRKCFVVIDSICTTLD